MYHWVFRQNIWSAAETGLFGRLPMSWADSGISGLAFLASAIGMAPSV